jgi:hypothetical protein
MRRLWFVAPMIVAGMCCCGFLMGDDKKPAKEPIYITKQLPANYSKLGLSQKQKNDIYKIRGKCRAEIQELTQKIQELRDQEKADCENVLTAEQLARYRQIVLGADRKKSANVKETEAKEKKLDKVAKSKKKDAETKDKKTPVEIKK